MKNSLKCYLEITIQRPKDYNPLSMYFYSYKGNFFRDFLFLETEEEFVDSMKEKITLYDSLEECKADFDKICLEQQANILSQEKVVS